MPFEPDKITKQHILDAVKKIDSEAISLEPSTRFDVIVNGKAYPPKEVMRYAHELMNGERIWERSGGEPTNKYFTALGFETKNKSNFSNIEINLTGKVWKLGCKWGEGATSFYDYIKENEIVICTSDKRYSIGDLIIIADGHDVLALAKVLEKPVAVINSKELEEGFIKYNIDYENWVEYSKAEWFVLPDIGLILF